MAADLVQADYDELGTCSEHFANQADMIGEMMQRIGRSMAPLLGDSWQGRGVEAFENEMRDDVMPAVQRLYQALGEACLATRDISQTLQNAEEEASAPFRMG